LEGLDFMVAANLLEFIGFWSLLDSFIHSFSSIYLFIFFLF